MAQEYVRVSDKETRHHYTITRARYERAPELFDLLKQDAVDAAGDPLPPKYRTTVADAAAKKNTKSGQPAESDKE